LYRPDGLHIPLWLFVVAVSPSLPATGVIAAPASSVRWLLPIVITLGITNLLTSPLKLILPALRIPVLAL
jgi:hypothetical protein